VGKNAEYESDGQTTTKKPQCSDKPIKKLIGQCLNPDKPEPKGNKKSQRINSDQRMTSSIFPQIEEARPMILSVGFFHLWGN
jgi:hypothetical protein